MAAFESIDGVIQPEKNNDSSAFDAGAKAQLKPVGASGTNLYSGYFSEDYLQLIRGRAGAKVYDEIRRSESQVAMLLNAVMNPIKSATWEFEAASAAEVADAEKQKDLVEYIAKEMLDWETHLHEALTFLVFGYSIFEVVNNVVFNHPKFGTFNGIKGLAFRSQKTIERWIVSPETGELEKVIQWVQGDTLGRGKPTMLEMLSDFLLVFTLQKEGDNFEGISALRPMYGPWFRKNLYLKIAAIGLEKNAIGTPMGTIPAGKNDQAQIDAFKEMLSNFTAHESAFITKPTGWDVEVLKSDFDAAAVKEMILLENTEMINSMVANFLALGMNGGGGAFALGSDLSDFFLSGIQTYANIIAGVWNRKLIPNLIKLNFGEQQSYPKLRVTGINDKAGKELAEIMKALVDGKIIKADDKLEEFSRKQYKLPASDPTTAREPVAPAPTFGAAKFSEDYAEDMEEIELGGPGSGPQPGGGTGGPVDHNEKIATAEKKMKAAKRAAASARSRADTAPDRAEKDPKSLRVANEKIRAYNAAAAEYNAALDARDADRAKSKTLLEPAVDRIQLAETYKKKWATQKADVKEVMQVGLGNYLDDYKSQLKRQYKSASEAAKPQLALKIEPSTAAYTKALREVLAEIANDALIGARKETPKAKSVKLSETLQLAAPRGGYFDALPANIKRLVQAQANLITTTQAADIAKVVSFQYFSSQASTDDIDQILLDIDDAVLPVIEGSTASGTSIDAAAGNATSQVNNQARLEWFFEPEVLNTIESFTFVNEDPISEICQELDGKTWAVGDPDLDRYSPPLHHNCKSRLEPNEKGAEGNPEIDRAGTSVSEKALKSITLCEHDYRLDFQLAGPKV